MKTLLKKFVLRYFAALLIGILLLISLIATGWMIEAIRDNIEEIGLITSPDPGYKNDSVAAFAGEQFIIREYEGRIGIFSPDDTQPTQILNVYVAYLPEGDRIRLRNGIQVSGSDELNALIEELRS